jgi:hypothetical protein
MGNGLEEFSFEHAKFEMTVGYPMAISSKQIEILA